MNVYVTNLNQEGIVTSLVNKSNQVQVQIGNAKMMVSLNNIRKSNKSATKISQVTSSYKTNKTRSVSSEINVIGYNIEEAISMADTIILLTKRPATIKKIFNIKK